MEREKKEAIFIWICFFISLSALLFCTLPMLLVALGFGETLAAIAYHFEWLTVLIEYKFWIFLFSGFLLLIANWLLNRPERMVPSDQDQAKKCYQLNLWNNRVLRSALIVWVIGFISAYLAVPITIWMNLK